MGFARSLARLALRCPQKRIGAKSRLCSMNHGRVRCFRRPSNRFTLRFRRETAKEIDPEWCTTIFAMLISLEKRCASRRCCIESLLRTVSSARSLLVGRSSRACCVRIVRVVFDEARWVRFCLGETRFKCYVSFVVCVFGRIVSWKCESEKSAQFFG